MIGSGLTSIKHRKDKQLTEKSTTLFKEMPKDSLSSLKIIKIETSTLNETFSKSLTKKFSSNSPKSTSLSSSPSTSPQPSTVITSIQVSPNDHHNQRSQCYITTYTPYRDLIRTNVINMESPLDTTTTTTTPKRSIKCSPTGEQSVTSISSSSPSPSLIGTVSSSSSGVTKTSRNGRSGSKKNGRWTFTNCRERQRQQNVNEAFQELRAKIPTQPVDKKLSKCSILTRAIEYIKLLNGILEKMDDDEEDEDEDNDQDENCAFSGIRKRSRYCSSNEVAVNSVHCKSSSRNSVITSSSSSSIHDYESDGAGGGEEILEDEVDEKEDKSSNNHRTRKKKEKKVSSRISSCSSNNNRPLETNVSITRVNTNLKGSQTFNQINERLNCSPIVTRSSTINRRQRSFCQENLCDGLSQDSQETLRSSEDKMIMDDVSIVSYEFDSSGEQSISSTVSSPSDSD